MVYGGPHENCKAPAARFHFLGRKACKLHSRPSDLAYDGGIAHITDLITARVSPMDLVLRRHAEHCTYAAALAGAVLLIVSFWFAPHWAWFLRGIILGMFVMVAISWAKVR